MGEELLDINIINYLLYYTMLITKTTERQERRQPPGGQRTQEREHQDSDLGGITSL